MEEEKKEFLCPVVDAVSNPFLNCKKPINTKNGLVPCGHCRLCLVSRRSEWSFRLLLESLYYKNDVFFGTLTYNDDNVPLFVSKKDVQSFVHSLRESLSYKIRYFIAGEYGETTFRPHYHFIIFGIKAFDLDKISKCWARGFVQFSPVNFNRFRYCTGYVQKKLKEKGLILPFSLKSTKPGIGFNFYDEHKKEMYENFYIPFQGVKHPIPRYFRKLLAKEFPDFKQKFLNYVLEKCNRSYSDYLLENDSNSLGYFDWSRSVIKQREIELKKSNDLYLLKKRCKL